MGKSQLHILKLHNLGNYAKDIFFKLVARCFSGLAAGLRHRKIVISWILSSHVVVYLLLNV